MPVSLVHKFSTLDGILETLKKESWVISAEVKVEYYSGDCNQDWEDRFIAVTYKEGSCEIRRVIDSLSIKGARSSELLGFFKRYGFILGD